MMTPFRFQCPPVGALRCVLFLLPSFGFAQAVVDPPEENPLTRIARALPDTLIARPYKNEFSVSLRMLGSSKVRFSNLGEIRTDFEDDDPTDLVARVYADGYVSLDTRGESSTAENLSDGMTNNWSYDYNSQVTEAGDGIMMHAYSALPNAAFVDTESRKPVNPDLEYSRMLWQGGRVMSPRRTSMQLGWLAGWGLSDVNAKYRGKTTADLLVITDTYSLNGAPVPYDYTDDDGNEVEGYTAPSTTTIEIVGDDGVTRTYEVDNSTLLANRPTSRTTEIVEDGATIDGFWQVSGAYFTLRSGPWMRWEPMTNFSLKLSGGGTFTLLGLSMNYQETLVIDEDTESAEVSNLSETVTESYAGIYGSVDGEWLLNEKTSFFASAYYENFDEELSLELDGRKADVEVSSGLGLRIGVTTRF